MSYWLHPLAEQELATVAHYYAEHASDRIAHELQTNSMPSPCFYRIINRSTLEPRKVYASCHCDDSRMRLYTAKQVADQESLRHLIKSGNRTTGRAVSTTGGTYAIHRMQTILIRIPRGDTVTVQINPYDLTKDCVT